MQHLSITVETPLLPELAEILEDSLRDAMEQFGITAFIEDGITGNITRTRTPLQRLRDLYERRAGNPPIDALPWNDAWKEYSQEMRELENQLRVLGEDL